MGGKCCVDEGFALCCDGGAVGEGYGVEAAPAETGGEDGEARDGGGRRAERGEEGLDAGGCDGGAGEVEEGRHVVDYAEGGRAI